MGAPAAVASNCGGPTDIVTEDVERLVQPEDSNALANAIAEIIDDARRYDPTRLRARVLRKFGWPRVTAQYLELFEHTVYGPEK